MDKSDNAMKVAVITGAASGIGRAAALVFARCDVAVVLGDVVDSVEETAIAVREAGGEAVALVGDAGREDHVVALVEAAQREFGGLDTFFANAGITGGPFGFASASADVWLEVLRINLVGPALAVKHAAPLITARGGGAIVCTASIAGLRAGAGPAAYSASKAGVINLVQCAALELAGTGVRVNAICPGLIETGMTKPIYDWARAAGKLDQMGTTSPARRGGQPEEVAELAAFLASDAAAFINGQAIAADGGLSAMHPMPPRPPLRPGGDRPTS